MSKLHIDYCQDIYNQLNSFLLSSGYSVNEKYPVDYSSHDSAEHIGYIAWNIAYQYYNILRRSIAPRARRIELSREFVAKKSSLSNLELKAISALESDSLSGKDLTRYLSTRMQSASFQDNLFNEFGLVHFHLGEPSDPKPSLQTSLVRFVGRTAKLLFAYPTMDAIYILDLLDHRAFSEKVLMEILLSNWPNCLAGYKFKNFPAPHVADRPTSQEIGMAWKKGLSVPLALSDNRVYSPPGGGLSTAGTSIRATTMADDLFNVARWIQNELESNLEQILEAMKLDKLEISLVYEKAETERFHIVEKQLNIGLAANGEKFIPIRH